VRYLSQVFARSSGVQIAQGTPVHLRHFHSILLAGAFVLVAASFSTAQVLTTPASSSASAGSLVELQFSTPSASQPSCLHVASEDNIVWGTLIDLSTGQMCGGESVAADDNIVWGTSDDDNIVWGTAFDEDNIVWGTDFGDNIVWGTGTVSVF